MRTVLILSGFLVLAFLSYRHLRRAAEDGDDEPMTLWDLFRTLFAPLLLGIVLLVATVRGLVRGELPCQSKGGGCTTDTVVRAVQPEAYWVNLGFFALTAGLLLWLAWLGYRRWCAARS